MFTLRRDRFRGMLVCHGPVVVSTASPAGSPALALIAFVELKVGSRCAEGIGSYRAGWAGLEGNVSVEPYIATVCLGDKSHVLDLLDIDTRGSIRDEKLLWS